MSSSYFEVKETVNDESVLSFGLEACEENGLLTSQLDGEMAKDHTYTKEPDIVQDRSDDASDSLNDAVETNKPTGRSQRNVKPHKFIKSTTTKEKEIKSKKDSALKKVVGKASKKAVVKQPKSPAKKEVTNNKKDKASTVEQNAKEDKMENCSEVEIPEQSKSKRRASQKRKLEEKENIAEEQPPFSDVALIENNAPSAIVKEDENSKKSKRKATAQPVESPKKRKVVKEREVVKKAAKAKTVTSDTHGVMVDSVGLPTGWIRKVVVRKTGKTAGKLDVYIFSPDGEKFRSKPDVASYLARTKSNLKLENFNFTKPPPGDTKAVKTPAKKMTPVVKSKVKESVVKKSTPSTLSKRGQKLVVKLKFTGGKKNATDTKKTVAGGSSAKKSNATKSSGSGKKSNKKKKSA